MAVRPNAVAPEEGDGELLLEHRAFVGKLCRILLRDSDESEDAAQQVFLHAYRALGQGVRPLNARSWLAEIARNECRSRVRRAAARPEAPLRAEVPADGADPAELAEEHAFVARLQRELADLPDRQREAVLLREFRGLSYRELAAAMGETEPAVESLLQRARRRLAEQLDGARRPLPGVALALESTRSFLARLLPGSGATESMTAGGAAAVLAKVTAAGVVATGVGVATGDTPRRSHAPAAPAVDTALPAVPREPWASPPPVVRRSPVAVAVATAPATRHEPRGESGSGPDGSGHSDSEGGQSSPGPAGTSSGSSDEGSAGSGSSGSGSSGSGSSSSGSGSSVSGSSGPGSGSTETTTIGDSSGSDNSGSGSESDSGSGNSGSGSESGSGSASSGPGSGSETSSSSGSSQNSGSDQSGASGPG